VGLSATLGNLSGLEAAGAGFAMVDGSAYDADKAYKDSKLCNVLFARELERRLQAAGSPVQVNAFGPGLITRTGGGMRGVCMMHAMPLRVVVEPELNAPHEYNFIHISSTDAQAKGAAAKQYMMFAWRDWLLNSLERGASRFVVRWWASRVSHRRFLLTISVFVCATAARTRRFLPLREPAVCQAVRLRHERDLPRCGDGERGGGLPGLHGDSARPGGARGAVLQQRYRGQRTHGGPVQDVCNKSINT